MTGKERLQNKLIVAKSSLLFLFHPYLKNEIIQGYGVAICAHNALGEKLIRAYVGTNGRVLSAQPVTNEFLSP